jgi:hypothetical protein
MSVATAPPEALAVFRDDGPVARALGGALGRAVPVPAPGLAALGAVPLLALIAFAGADVSVPAAAAAVAWTVLCIGVATGRRSSSRLRWVLPPAARLSEFAGLIWLGAIAGDSSVPAAFALLCAIAFRGYDLVYRYRQRGVTPARWVTLASGGWDGRLLLGLLLLAAGALPAGFYVWAAAAAAVFAGEAVAGWAVSGRAQRPDTYDEEEDEA